MATSLGPAADFLAYAAGYGGRNVTVCRLRVDDDGKAKVPMDGDYPRLRPEDNASHNWGAAAGLGIVLGSPSLNMAVIDVDDIGLSDFLVGKLASVASPPLMVRTVSHQLHVYCIEPTPSDPIDLEVTYQGRHCLVQLFGRACVAAAPPTPGYDWVDVKTEPYYGAVGAVWNRIAKDLGLYYREARPYSFLRRERSRGPTTAQIRAARQW